MIIDDGLLGVETIEEPVLWALLESAAVTRLRGVRQHGVTALIGLTESISRFDHSVGAMIIVRRLGASLPEQIAALLHDVSHTAFSHVIDHVFDSPLSQRYHEVHKESHVAASDLPQVLADHGYAWRDFLDEEAYTLLEQPAPALCADRLDYCLRDAVGLNLAGQGDIDRVLSELVVATDGAGVRRMALQRKTTARWLAEIYLALDEGSWANFREVGLYELTGQAIRRALQVGALVEADVWGTDDVAWAKLQACEDAEVARLLSLVTPATAFARDETAPDFWVHTKLRTIDPDVLVNGRFTPLSQLDSGYAVRREKYLSRKAGAWPMRVIPAPTALANGLHAYA